MSDQQPPRAAFSKYLTELDRGADFVLGVVVALAVGKAIEGVLHSWTSTWNVDPLHPALAEHMSFEPYGKALEVARLAVFIVMIIRFYFGWLTYSRTYLDDKAQATPAGYLKELCSALFHFAAFFAWSLTLTSHERFWLTVSSYLVGMVIVLGYTVFWVLALRAKASEWFWRNVITIGLSALLLAIVTVVLIVARDSMGQYQSLLAVSAESAILVFIALVSCEDILEILRGEKPKVKYFVLCGPELKLP